MTISKLSECMHLAILMAILSIVGCRSNKISNVKVDSSESFTRTKDKTSRIWFAPFVDEAGNQHEASYVNIVVNSSKWTRDEVREDGNISRNGSIKSSNGGKQEVADSESASPDSLSGEE